MTQEDIVTYLLKEQFKVNVTTWSILRDHHASEDIFQEIVIKALARMDTFSDTDHLIRWARTSARNLAIDKQRKQQRRNNFLSKSALDAVNEDLMNLSEEDLNHRLGALEECLSKIPENTRNILLKRYRGEDSVADIAKRLGRTSEAIYQTLSRTQRKLRLCIENRLRSN